MPTHDSLHTRWRVFAEPDRLIQSLLVLNNDMQLLRMSMSFPVFVRSYLVLLWKPNVILNPPSVSPCGFSDSRKKTVCSGEPGLISNFSCSCQARSDDTWKRQNVQQQCESRSGEFPSIYSVDLNVTNVSFKWILFLFQVVGSDMKDHPTAEEETSLLPTGGNSRWDFFFPSSPERRTCSQKRHPSSPHNDKKGIQSPGQENWRGPFPRLGPPSPFPSSTSFPSSPLASPFRLFEGAQRHQTLSGVPVFPSLPGRGCSLTEASRGLR